MAVNNNITLSQVREEILRNKVLREQNLKKIDELVTRVKMYRESLDDNAIETLRAHGIFIESITNIDEELIKNDKEYLASVISNIKVTMDKFKEVVMDILHD